MTFIAWYVMRHKYPIPDFKVFNITTNFCDLPGHFMTENAGSLSYPIPFHNVSPTDSAGFHFYEDLLIGNRGLRSFLDSYVVIGVINSDFHTKAGFKGSRIRGFEIKNFLFSRPLDSSNP